MSNMDIIKASPVKPKCAVILAAYNGGEFIESQIRSINAQVNVNVTIFVTDDVSTDDTLSICLDNGAKIVNNNAKLGSACKNFLFSIGKLDIAHEYDYIFLSDQDDIWLPEKCIEAIKALEKNNCECYSGSYYLWLPNRRKVIYSNRYFLQTDHDYLFRGPGPGFTFAFTADAYRKIRCNLLTILSDGIQFTWHDWLIYACARHMNLSWYIDKNPYSLYRLHAANETGQALDFQSYKKRFQFLFDGSYRAEILKFERFAPGDNLISRIKSFSILDRLYLLRMMPTMRSRFVQRIGLTIWLLHGK